MAEQYSKATQNLGGQAKPQQEKQKAAVGQQQSAEQREAAQDTSVVGKDSIAQAREGALGQPVLGADMGQGLPLAPAEKKKAAEAGLDSRTYARLKAEGNP